MRRLATGGGLVLIGLLGIGCGLAAPSRQQETLNASVDDVFKAFDRTDSPGCAVGISRNGAIVYEHGYGMASLELGVPITPDTTFLAASISKPFTATNIMLLAERGLLSIDDPVRKYIVDLPDYGAPLTIRHLLTHTGGIREGFVLEGLAAPSADSRRRNDVILAALTRQKGLNFPPGARYQYNNSGYAMLASIVERVSGQSFVAFTSANIFTPLGMTHSQFVDNPTIVVSRRANGYAPQDNGFRLSIETPGVVGNDGLYTTVGDLLRWQDNFVELRVGTRQLVTEMEAVATLNDGSRTAYGKGLEIGSYRGARTAGHSGGDRGAATNVTWFPEYGLAIAVLCNTESADPIGMTRAIADIYLADTLTPALPVSSSPAPVSVPAEALSSKAGLYQNPTTHLVARVSYRDGTLGVSDGAGEEFGFALTPISETRFRFAAFTMEFLTVAAGQPPRLRILNEGFPPEELEKLPAITLSSTGRAEYSGNYVSGDADVTYSLIERGDVLVVVPPGRDPIPLLPIGPDMFAGRTLGTLIFTRDRTGRPATFTVNTPAARGILFERVK